MLKEERSISLHQKAWIHQNVDLKITQNQGQIQLLHSHLFSNPSEERQIYPMQYRRAQTPMDADSSYNVHLLTISYMNLVCTIQHQGSAAPSIYDQWPATWALSDHLQRKRVPCSSELSDHHGCPGLFCGYHECSGGYLPMLAFCHLNQLLGCSNTALPHAHHPWNEGMPCILEPHQAEKLQNAGRNTVQNNGIPIYV